MKKNQEHIPYPTAPYHSRRQPVYAANGVVAASQPLASQAGMTILQKGGNAVDAAIAAAVVLTVVQPASCGIGGDAFALVWDGRKLHGLNGSGRAPGRLTADIARKRGYEEMPWLGWLPVTVPGAPAAWRDLHQRFGRLPFADLFETAVAYAEEGYPVSPMSQFGLHRTWNKFRRELNADDFARWADVWGQDGRPPRVGELWRHAGMARTLRRIAETDAEAFYTGELAEEMAAFATQSGGFLSADDLANHRSSWVEPISANYRGYDVWEIPPNGQGLAALIALNILEGFGLADRPRESVESYHLQLEAMKLAFADARRYIADPERAAVPTEALLSKAYATERRQLITDRAALPEPGDPQQGGTVYLAAADSDGMMISLIESTYTGFGSGMVVPGTGIALQNRGKGFTLEPGHRNELEPGKRPFHTIIPGFLTKDGRPVGPFGVMGGHMQPQGHVQMVVNTVDYGLNPQASLDATRWHWQQERAVKLEPAIAPDIAAGLQARGHAVEIYPDVGLFGNGQIIWRLESGAYAAGSDGRADGGAVGY